MLFYDWCEWIHIFLNRFLLEDHEDESRHLEDVQEYMQKAWILGRDEHQR